jgi:hypothetical protein
MLRCNGWRNARNLNESDATTVRSISGAQYRFRVNPGILSGVNPKNQAIDTAASAPATAASVSASELGFVLVSRADCSSAPAFAAKDNAFDVSEAAMALTASAETIPTRWPATSTTFGTEISTTGADVTFALRVGALALALKGGNARLAGFTPRVMRRIVCSL